MPPVKKRMNIEPAFLAITGGLQPFTWHLQEGFFRDQHLSALGALDAPAFIPTGSCRAVAGS